MPSFMTRRLVVLATAHFTIDSYSSFFLPLLPLLMVRLGLNYTMIGSLVAIGSMSSSFSQPLFGLLSDRLSRPWFVVLGPLVAAVFLSSIGLATNYAMLVTLLVIGGFGVAMFHPQTAAMAGNSSSKRGMAMSFWVTGGTLGWALGPLFATSTAHAFGLGHTYYAAIPGALMCVVLGAWFLRQAPVPHAKRTRTRLSDLSPIARPLLLLYFAVTTRSAVSSGFATFLPLYAHAKGWSVATGGTLTTVYLLAGALGGMFGGWLADHHGGRTVVRQSFLFSIPFYVLFFALPDKLGIPCLVLGYFILQGSLPVNVVMGQELSPAHSGTISSLLMGAAWGLGALLIGPIGLLADHAGLHTALMVLSSLILVGLGCAMALPDIHRHASAGPQATAEPELG